MLASFILFIIIIIANFFIIVVFVAVVAVIYIVFLDISHGEVDTSTHYINISFKKIRPGHREPLTTSYSSGYRVV